MKKFLFNVLPYISIFSLTALIFVGLPLELIKHYSIFEIGMTLTSFYLGTIITPFLFYRLEINTITTRITLIMCITAVSSLFLSLNIENGALLTMVSLFLLGISKNIILTFYDSEVITKNYNLYRGVGSIFFVLTTLSIGLGYLSLSFIGIILAILFLINYIVLFFENKVDKIISSRNIFSIKNLLEYKIFWLSILFHRIGMGLFISFAGIFIVKEIGYSELNFSFMWIVAASFEALTLLFYVKFLTPEKLIIISLYMTILRFLLVFLFPEYYSILLFSQGLHLFSYAVYNFNILKILNITFKERTPINIKIYHSISEGLAMAIGSILGIFLHKSEYFFLFLSIFTIISFILFKVAINKEILNGQNIKK